MVRVRIDGLLLMVCLFCLVWVHHCAFVIGGLLVVPTAVAILIL